MDVKKLSGYAISLIMFAAIILSAIAIVLEYEDVLKDDTDVINESITIASKAGTTANDELNSVSYFGNFTTIIILNNESTSNDLNYTESGEIKIGGGYSSDGLWNISYEYKADTTESESAQDFKAGLAIFAAFVGILVISAIGIVIINLFRKKQL